MSELISKLEEELKDLDTRIGQTDDMIRKRNQGESDLDASKIPFRVLAAKREAMRMYHEALTEQITIVKFS